MTNDYLKAFLKEIHEDLPEFAGFDEVTINTRTSLGDTPLHVAAIRGNLEAIQALLKAGADANAQGEDGYTPLHEAVAQGHVQVVRLLIDAKAKLDIRNDDGDTPSDLAEIMGEQEILEMLR